MFFFFVLYDSVTINIISEKFYGRVRYFNLLICSSIIDYYVEMRHYYDNLHIPLYSVLLVVIRS